MDLKNLVLRGFATSRLTTGGDEQAQDPKWLGQKAQAVLLDRLRTLASRCESIDGDEDLSGAGRARKKAELGTAAIKEIESDLSTIRSSLASKRETARARLAQAGKPEGQSDIDRLARLLEVQGMRQLLLGLGGQELLGELIRSSREGDMIAFEAIAGLPAFVLRDKSIAKESIEAARREIYNKVDPSAVSLAQDSEQMATLVDQNMAEAQRAIREHCGIPEERQTTVLK